MNRQIPISAADFLPAGRTLPALRQAAATCRGCELYMRATQTVFGEGPEDARVIFVGEVPGDQEDRQGRPFVGPAGRILEKAAREAGVPWEKAYLTNAVKHFNWEPRGTRRIHKKPREGHIEACLPWLTAEVEALAPEVVVCLGSTAVRAVFGRTLRVGDYRGSFHRSRICDATFVTVHPSSLLRLPEAVQRHEEYARFVNDLRKVGERLRL